MSASTPPPTHGRLEKTLFWIVIGMSVVYCVITGLRFHHKPKANSSDRMVPSTGRTTFDSTATPNPDPEQTRQFLGVEAQRRQADQTTWPNELLAERHEDVFMTLWDALRRQDDEFAVLREFKFGELVLGDAESVVSHDHGIRATHFGAPRRVLDRDAWRLWLNEMKEAGYRVEQTEWRQPRFDPGPPPMSTIYFSAHVANTSRNERLILRGNLRVEWSDSPDPTAPPTPRRIDASDLEMLVRKGGPGFRPVVSTVIEPDPGTIFIDPLIAYDLNGDGLSEIILGCKNRVFWNRGNGQFEPDVLCKQLKGLINTCIVADFDGDGQADVLAADHDGLLLFVGNRQGQFNEPGRRVWVAPQSMPNPFVMTAGDIDGDGDLDLWLAQYKLPYVAGQMPTPFYDANDGFPSFLLVNDGHGNFSDGTVQAGLAAKRFRRSYSCSFVDLDADGDLDLLVVSDFAGVDLYENDGRGHFQDVTAKRLGEAHAFGMAHTFGDYDLDGRLDCFVVGMNSFVAQRLDQLDLNPPGYPDHSVMRPKMGYGNRLYFARGGKFELTAMSEQVARSGWSWGATSFDFDNDGDQDVYVVNGHKSRASVKDYERQFWRHDIYLASSREDPVLDLYFRSMADRLVGSGQSYGGFEKKRLFMNEAGRSFLEVGYLLGVSAEEDCRNLVSDDLDGDGLLDIVMTSYEEWPAPRQALHILRNLWPESGNWIGFRLREGGRGFSPIGARVTLTTSSGKQIRQIVTGDSYRSQHAPTAHFGLGNQTNVLHVEVQWPNGKVNSIPSPTINRYHSVTPNSP